MSPNQARDPALVVEGLTVVTASTAGSPTLVDDVSLSVDRGKTLGFVGASGSGKSMTAFACMGLLPAGCTVAAGSVRLKGQELLALNERSMSRIRGRDMAMVFQEPMTSLNPMYRVGLQIAEVLREHRAVSRRAAQARAVELLDEVGIRLPRERARAYPHELSGGMRQRVMIAMAIACEPSVILADEPTTALDVSVQAQVLELLQRLTKDHGSSLVLVSHDMGVIAQVADDVVVMRAGRIVESATVEDLFAHPKHPYTRALMDAVPRVDVRPPTDGRLHVDLTEAAG